MADASGKRVETVVQWVDRTQEVAIENEVQAILAKAIDGDLTARIREVGKDGFFKTLLSGVNGLLANMADVVRSMARAAAAVRTGSEEISRGNADLSQRTEEQGRGFAVVASEVRNLASRSAEAAKEIQTLIQDSLGKVTDGTKLVDESGKALAEIVVRVKKVTDVMAEIASSSHEQTLGIEQVNNAITMMDDVTQQNAALVEEASAAAQALTEQASNLTQLISRYRVGEGESSALPSAVARPARIAVAVERRAANRPMTGKKRPAAAAVARAPARSAGGNAAEEQWKNF